MEIANRKIITIDLKKESSYPAIQFIQLDSNVMQFRIEENSLNVDLSKVGRIIANFKRKDGTVISRMLTKHRNIATYTIGTEEMQQEGTGELELQFYSVDNTKRLTTKRFRVTFTAPIGSEEISESDPDLTVLQALLVEVDTVLNEVEPVMQAAIDATTAANHAATIAEEKATIAQNAATALGSLQSDLTALKSETETAKNTANDAAASANDAADAANSAAASANTAAQAANTAAEAAEDASKYIFRGEFDVNTVYSKNNMVRYSGSTFISLNDNNVGNTPNPSEDTANWARMAVRGVDGTGAVSSVNSVSPDANGNVELTAGALGALSTTQLGVANGAAKLNADGKVTDAAGNVVESFSKDYNDLTNKPTIPTKTSQLTNDSGFIESVPNASTSAAGIVKLNNSTTSTSTTEAATANAVKQAMDRANEAFQSASDGKNSIETAIIGKGGTVSKADDIATYAELVSGINSIPEGSGGGVRKANGTAVSSGGYVDVSGVAGFDFEPIIIILKKTGTSVDLFGFAIYIYGDVEYEFAGFSGGSPFGMVSTSGNIQKGSVTSVGVGSFKVQVPDSGTYGWLALGPA